HLALVGGRPDHAAHFPGLAVIVAEDHVGVRSFRAGLVGVTGHHQPARAGLNANAGTSGYPGPVGLLGAGGDVYRLRPGQSVILTFADPDGPGPLARSVHDGGLLVHAQVVGQEQPDGAGGAVHHRAGIAAGVVALIPDDLYWQPGLAAVGAALEHQVDVARV